EEKVKEQLEAAKPELIIEEVVRPSPMRPGRTWQISPPGSLTGGRLKGQEEELASAVDSAKQEDSDSD
ncbi:hypothetical protein E2320_001437, partial [Naja naja]